MQEALIADLARIGALKVISRTSARQYENTAKPLRVVAAELGVAYLIEGSVYRVGDQVRITVQLIDARSHEHLLAESYDRDLEDILGLQSEVARTIAAQIQVSLTAAERDLLTADRAVDPKAYELYLKGRFHWGLLTKENLQLAIDYFRAAIDRDPDYALAWVGYADATATLGHVGIVPAAEVFPLAKGYVERALALDDSLAEAHDLLARIRFAWDWDWAAAGAGFERAIALKPNYPDAYVVYSQYLAIVGRGERVLEMVLRGVDLDPLSAWFRHEHANRLLWLGRYEEGLAETERLLAAQPGVLQAHRDRWIARHLLGADREALVSAQAFYRLSGEDAIAAAMGAGFERGGYAEAMMSAARTLTAESGRPHVDPVDLAEIYAHAGRMGLAMDALEQALRSHESALVYTTVNPLFEPLWDDPRFMALRRAMNLPAQRGPLH
jgi:tetratricopeptide (TPR) repeat protein